MNHSASSKLGCVAVMLALCLSSCTPKKAEELLQPTKTVGVVLAEESMRTAGENKTIALIAPDAQWGAVSTVEKDFRSTLQSRGFSVIVAKSAYLGDPMRIGHVGLQPADFFEGMHNAAKAGAVVSLAGVPLLTPSDAAQLPADHPPILVAAVASLGEGPGLPGNRPRLESLLAARVIQVAIIDGGDDTGTNSSAKPDSVHALFARNYRILREPH
jgi:hypothetical protein